MTEITQPKPCTKTEAKALTARINSGIASLSADVFEAYQREAWRALGYPTWGAYVEGELEVSLRHSHRLIDLGKVEKEIEAATGEVTRVSHREADAIKDNLPAAAAKMKARVDAGEKPQKAAADVIAEQRAAKAAAKAEREAEQAELDRQREQARAALPDHIKRAEEAKAKNGSVHAAVAGKKPEPPVETPEQIAAHRDELAEENAALKADIEDLTKRLARFDEMAVQFEKGGFEAVIATKDERIRNLQRQVETESADKAAWKRKADFWKKTAINLGYVSPNSEVETPAAEVSNLEEFSPF